MDRKFSTKLLIGGLAGFCLLCLACIGMSLVYANTPAGLAQLTQAVEETKAARALHPQTGQQQMAEVPAVEPTRT